MKNKIQKFLDWLIQKTREKKVYWRQERWGSELFTCTIQKESGMATVSLLAKAGSTPEEDRDLIIKIEFHKGPPVSSVSFLYEGADIPLTELYDAVKETVKAPTWLEEWINELIEKEEI